MLFIEIIVVVLFVTGVLRYFKITKRLHQLSHTQFPGCSKEDFIQWWEQWLLSEKIYLFISGPAFLLWLFGRNVIYFQYFIIVWFLPLLPAAFYGSNAARLDKKYGFKKALKELGKSPSPEPPESQSHDDISPVALETPEDKPQKRVFGDTLHAQPEVTIRHINSKQKAIITVGIFVLATWAIWTPWNIVCQSYLSDANFKFESYYKRLPCWAKHKVSKEELTQLVPRKLRWRGYIYTKIAIGRLLAELGFVGLAMGVLVFVLRDKRIVHRKLISSEKLEAQERASELFKQIQNNMDK